MLRCRSVNLPAFLPVPKQGSHAVPCRSLLGKVGGSREVDGGVSFVLE